MSTSAGIILRIVLLLIGYCFGLIQTGVIIGKAANTNLKEHGSGNTGTTNAMRVLGAKAGVIVFLGDFFKCFVPCMIVHFALKGVLGPLAIPLTIWTGLGVILGHSYPCYLHFKGGKGVACACALGLALDARMAVIALAVFVIVAVSTKFVSLASMLALVAMLVIEIIFNVTGVTNFPAGFRAECFIMLAIMAALIIFAHRSNIKRLASGNENKFSIHH